MRPLLRPKVRGNVDIYLRPKADDCEFATRPHAEARLARTHAVVVQNNMYRQFYNPRINLQSFILHQTYLN